MPSDENDPMDTSPTFDALIRRMRARDSTPQPGAGFVSALEGRLMATRHATVRPVMDLRAEITKPLRDWSRSPLTAGQTRRTGRTTFLMAACLVLVALGAGGLGYRLLDGGSTPEPATIAAVSSFATPNPNATPYAESLVGLPSRLDACTVEPRLDGYVEKMLSETSWYVPNQLPVQRSGNFGVLDGDYLVRGFDRDSVVPSDLTNDLNQSLLQLWACQIYDRRGDYQEFSDPDDRSWAVYSDNFFRRSFRQGWIPNGQDPRSDLWGLSVPQAAPIEIITIWDIDDGDVPRVAATVQYDSIGVDPYGVRWLVIFVQEGDRWLIDEFAPATFDDQASIDPNLPHLVEPMDLVIYDVVPGETPRNEGSISQLSDYADYYTSGGLLLRIHNLGTAPSRVDIPELKLTITIAPGTSEQLIVTAPTGTTSIDFQVSRGDLIEETVVGTFAYIEPGQPHGRG